MFTRLLTLTLVAAAVACSDAGLPSAPAATTPLAEPETAPALFEMAGVIEVTGTELDALFLVAGEERYALTGPEASLLAKLGGAEVRVRGAMNGAGGVQVESFRVLAVNGRNVIDGVVEMIMDEGFAIRLADGSLIRIDGAPADLADHIGARVWFASPTNDAPAAFGIIVE